MAAPIQLAGFAGEQPHVIPRLLPANYAQSAINCRLDDGGLTPLRLPVQVATADGAGYHTIYKFGATWLSWEDFINAAPGPVDDTRLYYTGDGVPKMRKDTTVYDLKVTPPATAPGISTSGAGAGDVTTRLYAYTWVTGYGEESEPSPASAPLSWQSGITVTLTGIEAVPAGRNITKMRFYRTQTSDSGTGLYFIAERAASNSNYTDAVGVDDFGEPLPSEDWNAPPDALEGLVPMANGMMAAFTGKSLYFCEPFRPHAWPEKYVLTTDFDIMGLAYVGSYLFVLTAGDPYIVSGSAPEAMQMVRQIGMGFPCVSKPSIVNLGSSACFASQDGLAQCLPDGSIRLATQLVLTRDQWVALEPSTMIGGQHMGRYVAFYDVTASSGIRSAGGLLIDLGDVPFLSRTDIIATATHYRKENAALYYAADDSADILQFDPPTGGRSTFYWRSKPFVAPVKSNYGAIRIDSDDTYDAAAVEDLTGDIAAYNAALIAAGQTYGSINSHEINEFAVNGDALLPLPEDPDVTIGVYADGVRVATLNNLNEPRRLPGGFKARQWEIDVAGTIPVTAITMAGTMKQLGAIG